MNFEDKKVNNRGVIRRTIRNGRVSVAGITFIPDGNPSNLHGQKADFLAFYRYDLETKKFEKKPYRLWLAELQHGDRIPKDLWEWMPMPEGYEEAA